MVLKNVVDQFFQYTNLLSLFIHMLPVLACLLKHHCAWLGLVKNCLDYKELHEARIGRLCVDLFS